MTEFIPESADRTREALASIWRTGFDAPAALEQVVLEGVDPVLPSNYRVGTAAAAPIAAAGLAAAEIWRGRGGGRQTVKVSMRAAAAAFRSERYLRIDGKRPPALWDPLSGFYPTGDGGWVQLHTNFPHHRAGVLAVLRCDLEREAVARAILGWSASALEDTLAGRGLCATMMRTHDRWCAHPQGRALDAIPLLAIDKLDDSPAEPAGAGNRPLSGVRVLDLSRILAGPVAGRCLAEHGADVMRVAAEHLPSIAPLVIDTGRGKLSSFIDLRNASGRDRLKTLVASTDVFLQAYRPGAIAGRGFSDKALAALRPGIVCVSVSAYGHRGPWSERRGFDSLVQTVSGIAHESGQDAGRGGPLHLPCQALDHATGYLAAFGAMAALDRRARHGGSWRVRVALGATGRWLDALGRVPDGLEAPDPGVDDVADLLQTTKSEFGTLQHIRPAAELDTTPAYWARPPVTLGTHPPDWPERG